MKTNILLLFVFLFFASNTFSQQLGKNPNREDLKSAKIAFLTQKLDLTVAEAQQFWPIYNEFDKKQDEIFAKRKKLISDYMFNKSNLTDAQLEKIADDFIGFSVEQEKIHQEYHVKFKKVLPIKKVILFYQAENQFKSKLIQQIGKKNKNNKQGIEWKDVNDK